MQKISDPLFLVNQWVARKEQEAEQRRLKKQQRKEQRARQGDRGSMKVKGEKKQLQKKQFVQKDFFPGIQITSKRELFPFLFQVIFFGGCVTLVPWFVSRKNSKDFYF
jgi:hypothetical protein